VKVGASVSFSVTVTVKDVDPVFPCESLAVQVTVVCPTGNVLPDGWLQVTGTGPSTRSVAVGPV
jgi:hypothetical protein